MKKTLNFCLDKVIRLLFLFERPPKDDGYIYERDFLGVEDYGKGKAEIFKPVLEKVSNDYVEIYNIKTSLYHEKVLARIRYCIQNRFWGLFSLALYDGYQLGNEEFFSQPSVVVYLIIDSSKQKHIVVVKSEVKHFEVLSFYKSIKSSIKSFKECKLIYSKNMGFTSL